MQLWRLTLDTRRTPRRFNAGARAMVQIATLPLETGHGKRQRPIGCGLALQLLLSRRIEPEFVTVLGEP
jgi:hypothetical protein